jgi:hypothetical protein
MAFDAARGVTVLFVRGDPPETWEWDGTSWALRLTTGPVIACESAIICVRPSMAYDSVRSAMVLFGGLPAGQTWELGVASSTCYANCDGSATPAVLDINDFVCFLDRFAAGDAYANCDGSTTPPRPERQRLRVLPAGVRGGVSLAED